MGRTQDRGVWRLRIGVGQELGHGGYAAGACERLNRDVIEGIRELLRRNGGEDGGFDAVRFGGEMGLRRE